MLPPGMLERLELVAEAAPGEGGAPERSRTSDGWLRILPHHLPGGLDGFFVARFARRR